MLSDKKKKKKKKDSYEGSLVPSAELWSLAFGWETLREAFQVSAVVVNHILLLHPTNPSSICCIKCLILPRISLQRIWIVDTRWWPRWPNTSIGLKISVRGFEWCFGPVSLHKPPSRCPIIGIPEAWVNPHGLAVGEWNTKWFQVVEHSYRNVIYQKPDKQEEFAIVLELTFLTEV